MADQKNRGGQKLGNQNPDNPQQAQGTNTRQTAQPGERAEQDKRQDQLTNPDDARREATDQERREQATDHSKTPSGENL
jgi:hypothetical protein